MNTRKQIIFTIVILSFHLIASAQRYIEYYNYVNEGEYNYYSSLYKEAIKAYEDAFSIESPMGVDLYRMARCQCKVGNTNQALKYLKLAGEKYTVDPSIYLKRDSLIITSCLSEKQYNDIKKTMLIDYNNSILKLNNSKQYKSLVDTVDYFVREDQKYRNIKTNPCFEEPSNTINCDSIQKEWFEHDSLLYNQFIQFIKDNGYPRLAGELSYVILLHFHENHYLDSKQLLIDEVNKGNMDPFFLGMMFERLDLLLYGDICSYYIWRKDNCSEVDWRLIVKNRKSIGMSIYYNGPRVRGDFNTAKLPWVK